MSTYFDTSIIIAKYKKNDIYYEAANQILNSDKIMRIISHISLVELASVLSRNLDFIQIMDNDIIDELSEMEKTIFLLKFILDDCKFNIHNFNGMNDFSSIIPQEQISMDYYQSIKISMKSQLRTLDNLHLAAITNILMLNNIQIDYFVTGDQEILDTKRFT